MYQSLHEQQKNNKQQWWPNFKPTNYDWRKNKNKNKTTNIETTSSFEIGTDKQHNKTTSAAAAMASLAWA
jgi:hypothetical protein